MYLMLMDRAFKVSQYEKKYFKTNVYGNHRYLSSFWDSYNKNLIGVFNFTLNRLDYWKKCKKTKLVLKVLNQCYQAPHTFEDNGYLPSIIELPVNEEELFEEHYTICYLVTQLAVVHYIR